jgi:hypothetical protein
MRIDAILHNVLEGRAGKIVFENAMEEHDFGDGLVPSIRVTVSRGPLSASRDIPLHDLMEPGFTGMVVSQMSLDLSLTRPVIEGVDL